MGRRRLQRKGDLYEQGGYWKLRWMEDVLLPDGGVKRGWSKPVWIGPSSGAAKLTKTQASRIGWENFLSKLDQNTRTPQSIITFTDFIEKRFKPDHVEQLKKTGKTHYASMLKHILPVLGGERLRDIHTVDVQRLVSGLKASSRRKVGKEIVVKFRPASQQMKTHVKNVVSAVFNHAMALEWYSGNNPAAGVKVGEMVRKPAHALSFEQSRQLLEALPDPYRDMVYIAIVTSMNVAEICGLTWKFVNLTDQWVVVDGEGIPPLTLIVRQQWSLGEYTTVKAPKRRRPIALTPGVASMLARLKTRQHYIGPTSPVFVSRNGTPIDQHNVLNRHLKPIGAKLAMPWLSWHVFRRSTATMADILGMSTGDRKGLLGHATTAMATHYVQSDHERQRAVLEQIERRLMGNAAGGVN
jgi:integrase